ncbi:uncharacterized protein LOC112894681 isoform X1 [Panicum hallii]|uniref:uncharacterized protein LOC112894681 isoform X1 n=1 Tax=Panicum hallii TaxID=206008 RepID=UPI000DF4F085|nr:uncharacterized protein LOC112894681 isoform X1 [Panicum hallii]
MPTSARPHRYAVVDAFTDVPFRGNPAAVCLLELDGAGARIRDVDRKWMLAVAAEFNAPVTAFLAPAAAGGGTAATPRFHIRWFTTVAEVRRHHSVELCGHATLAAAHFLLTGGGVGAGTGAIEFVTMAGLVLTARRRVKVVGKRACDDFAAHGVDRGGGGFCIELDFPVASVEECGSGELPALMPDTLNGASIVNVCKTSTIGDLMVELSSGEEIARLRPNFIEIRECAKRAMVVTGPAPAGSQVDFVTRLFAPNVGVDEDQVCGSVHCALVPYWAKKLGKTRLTAQMENVRTLTLAFAVHVTMEPRLLQGAGRCAWSSTKMRSGCGSAEKLRPSWLALC